MVRSSSRGTFVGVLLEAHGTLGGSASQDEPALLEEGKPLGSHAHISLLHDVHGEMIIAHVLALLLVRCGNRSHARSPGYLLHWGTAILSAGRARTRGSANWRGRLKGAGRGSNALPNSCHVHQCTSSNGRDAGASGARCGEARVAKNGDEPKKRGARAERGLRSRDEETASRAKALCFFSLNRTTSIHFFTELVRETRKKKSLLRLPAPLSEKR